MDVAWRALSNFLTQEGVQWSGAVAFYLVLSVPPLLIAAFSLAVAFVGREVAADYVVGQVTQFLPAGQGVVRSIVSETIEATGVATAVALVFLLFSGSRVFASLIVAINVMWAEVPEPGFIRRQLTRLMMVVVVGGLFAVAGGVELLIAVLGDRAALPAPLTGFIGRQVVPALLSTAALFILFIVVPRQAASWRRALMGAVVGMILLRLAQIVFGAYLAQVGGFESAYGPLAQAAVLMTWALVAAGAILLAAHVVAVLHDADRGAKDAVPGSASRPHDRR